MKSVFNLSSPMFTIHCSLIDEQPDYPIEPGEWMMKYKHTITKEFFGVPYVIKKTTKLGKFRRKNTILLAAQRWR